MRQVRTTLAVCSVFLAGLMSLSRTFSIAAQRDPVKAQVDQLFAQWDRRDSPGCALAVIRDGQIVHERGYGMADLEHDVAITPDTVFYVASVSKQFTAFAVVLAAKQGKLSLDDDIRKYLPEFPRYDPPVTVRHLVHNTGGLREYQDVLTLGGRRRNSIENNDEVVEVMARQKAPVFRAGDQFSYSNTGYALLASIIERAAGMTFSAFAEANIFTPLGMSDTHVHDDLSRLVVRRAYGYAPRSGGGFVLATPQTSLVGAAGVYTTVRDLAKWDRNFYDGRVGGLELIQQVQKTGTLNSGQAIEYAFGLFILNRGGLRIVEHGGDFDGYRAWLTRVPDRRFSVVCLCNQSDILQGNLATFVTNIYLATGGPTTGRFIASPQGGPPPSAPPPAVAAVTQPTDYAGVYHSDELDTDYVLAVSSGRLSYKVRRAPWVPLAPNAKDAFTAGGVSVTFVREAGRISGFTLDAERVKNLRFVKRPE